MSSIWVIESQEVMRPMLALPPRLKLDHVADLFYPSRRLVRKVTTSFAMDRKLGS